MCRHLAHLGPPVRLADLVLDQPHALVRQAWAPTDMRCAASVNADGFGVGWYPADGPPVRYRRAVPMWTDSSFASLAAGVSSGAVLAAVRSATVGMAVTDTACAPFAGGRWLFSHNGVVLGWPDSIAPLAEKLPVADLVTLDAPTDSALLWALVRDRLRRGCDATDAVASVVTEVGALSPDSRLNLLLTNGTEFAATTWWHSLSLLCTESSVSAASEPWDADPRWRPVDDHAVVTAALGPHGPDVRIESL